MITKRQGLIIWLRHSKYARRLRKYGHLIYTSRRQRYALIYVDQVEVEELADQISRLNFVKKVDLSYKPLIETAFQTKAADLQKEKEYEMKHF